MGEHKNEAYRTLAQQIATTIRTNEELWPKWQQQQPPDQRSFTLMVITALNKEALAAYDDQLRKIENPDSNLFKDALSVALMRAASSDRLSQETPLNTVQTRQAMWIAQTVKDYRDYLHLQKKNAIITEALNKRTPTQKPLKAINASTQYLSNFGSYCQSQGYEIEVYHYSPAYKLTQIAILEAGVLGFFAFCLFAGGDFSGKGGDYLFTLNCDELSSGAVFGIVTGSLFLIGLAIAAKQLYDQKDSPQDYHLKLAGN